MDGPATATAAGRRRFRRRTDMEPTIAPPPPAPGTAESTARQRHPTAWCGQNTPDCLAIAIRLWFFVMERPVVAPQQTVRAPPAERSRVTHPRVEPAVQQVHHQVGQHDD